jgi:hypothetical protein
MTRCLLSWLHRIAVVTADAVATPRCGGHRSCSHDRGETGRGINRPGGSVTRPWWAGGPPLVGSGSSGLLA